MKKLSPNHRPNYKKDQRSSSNRLEQLPLKARIAAVAQDVRSRRGQYQSIKSHELAELLGISSSRKPDGTWKFVRFQPRVPFEDIVSGDDGPEWMYWLKGHVDESRYAELEAEADEINAGQKEFRGEFLTAPEKQRIEELFMEKELSDSTYYFAFFTKASNGTGLRFEARIDDDGGCYLKTPYDERDGFLQI